MIKRLWVVGLFLVAFAVQAWTPAAEERIAQKSAALAPPDLQVLLEKYSDEYRRGFIAAATDEGTDAHRFILARGNGRLRQQIDLEVATVIKMLRTRQPIPGAVERLGRLVHYVSDANNPLNVADDYPELGLKRADYVSYFGQNVEKFPTVFYGLRWPVNPRSYVASIFERSAQMYPLLYEEYFRHGEEHSSAEFDDRSTAFGVASLSYSHAVSDLVNLYYYIWKEAGGDVRTAFAMRKGNLLLDQRPLLSAPRSESHGTNR